MIVGLNYSRKWREENKEKGTSPGGGEWSEWQSFQIKILYYCYVWVWAHTCLGIHVEGKGRPCGDDPLLPPLCGCQGYCVMMQWSLVTRLVYMCFICRPTSPWQRFLIWERRCRKNHAVCWEHWERSIGNVSPQVWQRRRGVPDEGSQYHLPLSVNPCLQETLQTEGQ